MCVRWFGLRQGFKSHLWRPLAGRPPRVKTNLTLSALRVGGHRHLAIMSKAMGEKLVAGSCLAAREDIIKCAIRLICGSHPARLVGASACRAAALGRTRNEEKRMKKMDTGGLGAHLGAHGDGGGGSGGPPLLHGCVWGGGGSALISNCAQPVATILLGFLVVKCINIHV